MTRNLYSWIVAAVMLLTVTACSNTPEILETIPATSQGVARMNLNKFADALGVKIQGDEVVFPAYLNTYPLAQKDRKEIASAVKAIDHENIYIFVTPRFEPIFTFMLNDADAFVSTIEKAGCKCDSEGGYTTLSDNGTTLLIKDNQAWMVMASTSTAVKTVDSMLESAKEKSVADDEYMVKGLDGSDAVRLSVKFPQFPNIVSALGFNFEKNTFKMETKTLGSKETLDSLYEASFTCPIGSDLKIQAPENALFVGAAGIKKNVDWNKLLEQATSALPFQYAATFQMISPVLKAVDGPVSLSLYTPDFAAMLNDEGLDNLSATLSAIIKSDEGNALLDYFSKMFEQSGITPRRTDNSLSCSAGPLRIGINATNNLFTANLGKPAAAPMKDYTSEYSKYYAAFDINIPSLKELLRKADFGLTVTCRINKYDGTVVVTTTVPDEPILQTFIKSF